MNGNPIHPASAGGKRSSVDRANAAAYRRDFVPGIVAYAVVLAVALSVVGSSIEGPLEWVAILAPVLPALWTVRAVLRHLRRVDEYQRLLQLEALAVGFGVAMVASLTIGFVGVGGVATRAAGWIVYGAGMAAWAAAGGLQARRR